MVRGEEKFCKSEFDAFLNRFYPTSSRLWRAGPKKPEDRPPDFYLFLDGFSYAVEVTTLADKTDNDAIAWIRRLASEVKDIARQRKCLHGGYRIRFSEWIDRFGKEKHKVTKDMLEYIQSTQDCSSAPSKTLFQRGVWQFISIEKRHDRSNEIDYVIRNCVSGLEASTKLCSLLECTLTRKIDRLRRTRRPKILLLNDEYHRAVAKDYYDCKPGLSTLLSSFHTVFVVRSDGEGFILHSENRNWLDRTK